MFKISDFPPERMLIVKPWRWSQWLPSASHATIWRMPRPPLSFDGKWWWWWGRSWKHHIIYYIYIDGNTVFFLFPYFWWWKKSCTTWDVKNHVNNVIFTISSGAGFLNNQQYGNMCFFLFPVFFVNLFYDIRWVWDIEHIVHQKKYGCQCC